MQIKQHRIWKTSIKARVSQQHLVIFSEINSLSDSSGLTSFSLGGGGSTVDYIIGTREAIQTIKIFTLLSHQISINHT